jgi:hypothetical protein
MPVLFRRAGLAAASLALAASLILTLPIPSGGAVSVVPDSQEAIDPTWLLCRAEIAKVEEAEQIPAHLLGAIALVESGRQAPGKWEISAWPWTVMAQGKGRYLPSKQAAIAEVEKLRKQGVRNIDVGCMQVNLRYHPDAFADLEEAFDPAANVAYAASFLTALRHDQGSWSKAVAHYHSATPERHIKYRSKVFAAWRDERRRALKIDFAADLAVVQLASARPVPESTEAPPSTEAVGDPVTLLAALAFGRSGPVTPEIEPGG